jgi:hypothetical protein
MTTTTFIDGVTVIEADWLNDVNDVAYNGVFKTNNVQLVTPTLGTPASGTLTNCTGLPIASGVSGLASDVATFLATPTSANLRAALTDETGTGSAVFATSPTLVTPALGTVASGNISACTSTSMVLTTPVLGAATGTSLNTTGNQTITGAGKQGYATGSGGAVAQLTSKSTGVTLDKTNGQITMDAANLAAATTVSFTLTNSTIEAGDIIVINHISGGTLGSYLFNASTAAGSATINVSNWTAGALAQAVVIRFAVIKVVSA